MPILSYIAHPLPGREADLARDLAAIPGCKVKPAETGPLLVLITETFDEAEEKRLVEQLKQVESLAFLSMVFAHADPEAPPRPGGAC